MDSFEALLKAVGPLCLINLPFFFLPVTVIQRNCQLSSKSSGELAQKLRDSLREDVASPSAGRGSRGAAL